MKPAAMEALRFVDSADVYKADQLAAQLRRTATGIEFSYRRAYLDRGGPAIAFTLPLTEEPLVTHAASALPPFFSGLLPEGRRLTALRTAIKTSADDELSLLLAVGGDTIGDVRVVPSGVTPPETEPHMTTDDWGKVRFADLLAPASRPAIDQVGLPGVQDKASARMISVPVARREARYILKLTPPEFPHLVENEKFFLDAAKLSGLAVAEAELVYDAEGLPGLLVRRFDRRTRPGEPVRSLAQEDACQVLGRYPADKYRLTAEVVVAGLAAVCRSRAVATRDLLRQFAFAYLTCNGDAHGKNFSVFRDGEWRVTPAYDLPSSHPYGDYTMALSVAGRTREDIDRACFLALAEHVGLSPRAAEKTIDGLLEHVDGWLARLDTLPFDARRIHKLRKAIEYRRDRLRALPRGTGGRSETRSS